MDKKALLIGATGLTGKECLNLLLNDDFYNGVEIWVRKSTGIIHEKLKEKIIDFDKIHLIANIDADHVFCCLGTTIGKAGSQANFTRIDHDYVIACAKVAEKSHAESFLYISSIGANKDSGNFYLRTKGQVEESLKKIIIPSVIIFRPSMLLGARQEHRFGEQIAKSLMRIFGYLLFGKLLKYRGIEASQVAKAMVHEAKKERTGLVIIESDKIQQYRYL
jgi:uncharacterized protein YbjT (DUF2867 family)